jgi:ribonucleoside-diphosphate reductase alpha chain
VQSTFTDFRYLSKKWRDNCEEERLLGVSLSGIMDCRYIKGASSSDLGTLKAYAVTTNKKYAKLLGINHSAAITCVKPSGTVSQLVNSSSGIHPRYSAYYIRRVRADNKDPLTAHLIAQGVPHEIDIHNPSAVVFSFPISSPSSSVTIKDTDAISQLELWKRFALNWCEHKPSISVYVKENEWIEVGAWVYKNFGIMSGVSFFPLDDHTYQQAPYERITEEQYNEYQVAFPVGVNTDLKESSDSTTGSQEFACVGGQCEL